MISLIAVNRRRSIYSKQTGSQIPLSQVSSCLSGRDGKLTIFRFLGEETYAKGQSRDYLIDEQPTWCIDPLDGEF